MTITNIHEYNKKKDKAWKLVFAFVGLVCVINFFIQIWFLVVFKSVIFNQSVVVVVLVLQQIIQKMLHLRLFGFLLIGGSSAARIASSNTFFNPLNFSINFPIQRTLKMKLTLLRQCRAFNIFDCFEVFGQAFALFNRNWFLFVLRQFLARAIIITQIGLCADLFKKNYFNF